jgi:predicted aspartyl protease
MNHTPTGDAQHTLTRKYNGLVNQVATRVYVANLKSDKLEDFRGIWDTGAQATVIAKEVVDVLRLQPEGFAYVDTASQRAVKTSAYRIDLYVKDNLCVRNLQVTLGVLSDDFHLLLGMDVIGLGDFSITNHNESTCMSYRYPSCHEIDYVKNPMMGMGLANATLTDNAA